MSELIEAQGKLKLWLLKKRQTQEHSQEWLCHKAGQTQEHRQECLCH
jgi:hypothetical protein